MSELLRHVRRGDVAAVHRLRQGRGRGAGGHRPRRPLNSRWWEDLWARSACQGASIGALVRGDEIILPDADTVIETTTT